MDRGTGHCQPARSRLRRPGRASPRTTARSRSASSRQTASRSTATNARRTGGDGEESTAITSASTSGTDPRLGKRDRIRFWPRLAANEIGVSDASALSDLVRPCSGLLDCNPAALPIVVGTVSLLSLGILLALFGIYRERSQGYVLAVWTGSIAPTSGSARASGSRWSAQRPAGQRDRRQSGQEG